MEEDGTTLRIGDREFHGWKADLIVFAIAGALLGVAFLSGLAIGLSA